jgi:hypothetical protein
MAVPIMVFMEFRICMVRDFSITHCCLVRQRWLLGARSRAHGDILSRNKQNNNSAIYFAACRLLFSFVWAGYRHSSGHRYPPTDDCPRGLTTIARRQARVNGADSAVGSRHKTGWRA